MEGAVRSSVHVHGGGGKRGGGGTPKEVQDQAPKLQGERSVECEVQKELQIRLHIPYSHSCSCRDSSRTLRQLAKLRDWYLAGMDSVLDVTKKIGQMGGQAKRKPQQG